MEPRPLIARLSALIPASLSAPLSARPSARAALAALVLGLGLVACAPHDAKWVHENLTLTENFHSGVKVLETPPIPNTSPHEARLRATARTRGRHIGADVELAVRAEFHDFSFLDRVSFASGRAFPLKVEKRVTDDCGTTDKSLCNVEEYVSVKLSRKFLTSKRKTGFDVKLQGRRESVVLKVPADYIEGLLARMEERRPDMIVAPESTPIVSYPAAPAR